MTESETSGLSISRAADILGKSPKTILRWIQRGILKAHVAVLASMITEDRLIGQMQVDIL